MISYNIFKFYLFDVSCDVCVLRSPSRDGLFPKEKERSGRAFRERVQWGTLRIAAASWNKKTEVKVKARCAVLSWKCWGDWI